MRPRPAARANPALCRIAPRPPQIVDEVYRARDTKLNRDVAIKVLLPSVSDDPDRVYSDPSMSRAGRYPLDNCLTKIGQRSDARMAFLRSTGFESRHATKMSRIRAGQPRAETIKSDQSITTRRPVLVQRHSAKCRQRTNISRVSWICERGARRRQSQAERPNIATAERSIVGPPFAKPYGASSITTAHEPHGTRTRCHAGSLRWF